jgi:ankyrin repeat protein
MRAQLLLDRGADPDIVGSTGFPVLDHAVKRGSLALVRALLAAGARADYCTDTATSIADALESSGKNRGAIVGEIEKCGWKIAGLR